VKQRIESLDLLRGLVMIIMALDHVRDYFHDDAFLYSPTDLSRTNVALFFTRWITHFCAPVFVFLAGISACLYGGKKGRKALSFFLFTRGVWLVLVELFIISLFRTFNLSFPFLNLQVIWVIGISMIVLSALIYVHRNLLLAVGIVLVAGHNLLDTVHVQGEGVLAFGWALLHDPKTFTYGHWIFVTRYPLLPWIGIMTMGYYIGRYYLPDYDPDERRPRLVMLGFGAIGLFLLLRGTNLYGDADHWSGQKSAVFTVLSFFNVTKYPPSLLYTLMTIGPALIFLAYTERPLGKWGVRVALFGRTAMFYYLAHILLIHIWALVGVVVSGYHLSDMILSGAVNAQPELKGYGFPLIVVYLVWVGLIVVLYPLCKWYDGYKRANQATRWWLSYI